MTIPKFRLSITFRDNNVSNQHANISIERMKLILDYNTNTHVHGRVQDHLMEALTSEESEQFCTLKTRSTETI